ncbi:MULTISPECIES: hypothetical protein [Nocardiopsidaceae]|uniref:DUF1430 domain-containing protein n=1 Tax=Streptomonospora nanhaiensis TaxID=1323731 RepID=A0ABY6YT89_9ACTN|nr:hypothetical protein [Streptomonospora nanhaiensis]WAE75604.1 hypothetical protein OUQ99_11195 [Streptomonospora nanhaiensis]
MPNRTIAFAHTALLVSAALIAALLLATWEATIPTAQHSASVWIVEDDGASDGGEVARTVERVAAEQRISVGLVVPDVRSPESLWHMYLAVGDPGSAQADWLTDGYPSFGRTMELRVHPVRDMADRSPRGNYLVFGPPENARVLADALAAHGLGADPGAGQARLWQSFLGGPLFHVLATALLVGTTSIGAGVLLDSRDHGVRRLHGHSYTRILLGDLGRVARLWGVALPAVCALTLFLLGLYNGWNQLGLYSLTALALLGVLAAAALVTHAAALGLVHATGVLPALRGRLPVRSTRAAVYLVRVPVLLLLLGVLASTLHLAQAAREQRAALEAFERTGETSHATLNGSTAFDDPGTAERLLGPWLRRADLDGELVVAERHPPASLVPVGAPRPGFDVLVVNDTYLARQEVLSPTGARYGAAPSDDRVRVLLPPAHAAHREAVEGELPDWYALQAGSTGTAADIEVLPLAGGQRVFTYGSRDPGGTDASPFLRDPVIVALPNGSALSDRTYVTYLTHEALLFPDPDVVLEARADPRVAEYVNTVQPILDKARSAHAAQVAAVRVELLALAAGTAVLLTTGVAACVIHVRTHAQTVFARHISGWGFLSAHRRFLAVEAVVALGFTGWAAWDTLAALRALDDPLRPLPPQPVPTSGLEPLYAAAVTAAGLALTLGALALFHRRIVREGPSRA